MANWTRDTLATRVLEHLGLVGTGQTANSTQLQRVGELIDSVHARLRKRGLAPYATSAVPPKFQDCMVKYLAYRIGPRYGYRGRALADLATGARDALAEMTEAAAAISKGEPVRPEWV